MKCPQDGATLVMSERTGVEIDYCPECRGVWLDRGELDKILERSVREYDEPRRARDDRRPPEPYREKHEYKKKKKNWLGEIMDF